MNQAKHVSVENSQAHLVFGDIFRFLVTGDESGGSYATMEVRVGPRSGPDSHLHEEAEEQFFVLEGHLTFQVGDQTFEASPGDLIHIPRGTTHSFKNKDTQARLLATFSPGAEGDIFVEIGQPIGEEAAVRHLGVSADAGN